MLSVQSIWLDAAHREISPSPALPLGIRGRVVTLRIGSTDS